MTVIIYLVNDSRIWSVHMKVSREQVAEHHRRIVGAAGKLFRENGFDGVGVADIMKSAGLTHGGFYGHFASKEDLVAQACAGAANADGWLTITERAPKKIPWRRSSASIFRRATATIRRPVACSRRSDRKLRASGAASGAPSPTGCVPASISWRRS